MRRKTLITAYYYMIGLYTAVLFGLGFAVFNIKVGAQRLPLIYVLFPFLDALTAVMMVKLITRHGLKRFYTVFYTIIGAAHLLLIPVLMHYFDSTFIYGVMLVVMVALSENLLFTRTYLVQDVFNLEELRKWIPIAISYGAVGALTGGLVLRVLEGRISSGLIFLLIYPLVFVSAFLALKLLKTSSAETSEIFSKRRVTVRSIWNYTTGQVFLPMLIACVALIAISDTINEYLFHVYSTNLLSSIEGLTGFLGIFLAVRYSLDLILNVFVYQRLVKKIGSLNIMPTLLFLAAAGLFIIRLSQGGLLFALIGRVVSTVAVIGMLLYLLEVFYQLLDPLYRPSLVTLVGYIDAFSGYAIGGGILLFHTAGMLSTDVIIVSVSILLGALALAWVKNRRGFIDVLNASQSVALGSSVEELIGQSDTTGLLENLLEKARFGSRSERLFLFYAIKKKPVQTQVEWLNKLFDISEMEIRVTILEHVFENKIFSFTPDLYPHELTDTFKNWLMVKCFVNYPQMKESHLFEGLKEIVQDTRPSETLVQYMKSYMFEADRRVYFLILKTIRARNRLEDDMLLNEIIKSYEHLEKAYHLQWFEEGHLSTPAVMAAYDEKLGYNALHTFVEQIDYDTLKDVVGAYSVEVLERELTGQTIFELLCLAESKCIYEGAEKRAAALMDILEYLLNCIESVNETHHTADLVLFELHKVRFMTEAVLVNQILAESKLSLTASTYSYIISPKRKPVLLEMLRGGRKGKWVQKVIGMLEKDNDTARIETGHRTFDIGDKNRWIQTLMDYNRGGYVNEEKRKEIDFMIALKSIPMFETLDIDTLKKLSEIVTVGYLSSGDTIVQKGERGKKFYVLMKGRAAVYLNEKDPAIAGIEQGEMIGELGLINNDIRTATVKADGPVELLSMDGDAFLELLKKNSAISMSVIKMLSLRLTDMLKTRGR